MQGRSEHKGPDWDALYSMAETQAGHFTTGQAAEAGYSLPLLQKYLASGRINRARRGIYRVVHFPSTEYEALVVYWLWTDKVGCFSHETALALHELSDVLPETTHITVPANWRRRRLRIPDGLVMHYQDIGDSDRAWLEMVPITAVARTIGDCIDSHLAPDLVRQAIEEARERGLISAKGSRKLVDALELSYGSPS